MTLSQRRVKIIAFVGVFLLAALQAVDMVTTRIVLHHAGTVEANPIAKMLLGGFKVDALKALWVVALVLLVWRTRQNVYTLLMIWSAVGVYLAVGLSNTLTLGQLGW